MNLSEIKSKTVPITLQDGKERHLRFTLNALALLEERYGSVDRAFAEVQKSNSIIGLRFMLWAGLSWEDEDLTEKEVGNLIDMGYMSELLDKLGYAIDDSLPADEQAQQMLAAQKEVNENKGTGVVAGKVHNESPN